MPFKQITIIGTGLIGGSFGLALRAAGYAGRIVGCDRGAVLDRAKGMRAISTGNEDAAEAVQGSDLIVLATPGGASIHVVERIGPRGPRVALITDTSTPHNHLQDR